MLHYIFMKSYNEHVWLLVTEIGEFYTQNIFTVFQRSVLPWHSLHVYVVCLCSNAAHFDVWLVSCSDNKMLIRIR